MGIRCGSQVTVCEYPISLDTYKNCTHACKYCFAQTHAGFENPEPMHCYKSLRKFIEGERTQITNWCDWNIPLHWGGMSDPFQPAEKKHKASLECLEVFKETQYPFIVSTKGILITQEPYLSLISQCNVVVQISMVCSSYDKLEPGAPSFKDRIKMASLLSGRVKRVIARVQPYITDICSEFINESIPAMAKAGIYGITVEGMKFKKRKPGLVRVGGDFCYPEERLKSDYERIREAAHKHGLKFFCAENRLRAMGENTACCGCGDLEGFRGNSFNIASILAGADSKKDAPELMVSKTMNKKGTAACFKTLHQETVTCRKLNDRSFYEQMLIEAKSSGLMPNA